MDHQLCFLAPVHSPELDHEEPGKNHHPEAQPPAITVNEDGFELGNEAFLGQMDAHPDSQQRTTAYTRCEPQEDIHIRAPVPLLYSQLDKAGLEAMESIAQGDSAAGYSPDGDEEMSDHYPPNLAYEDCIDEQFELEFDYSSSIPQRVPAFVFRPITPSTMIALTEPFLLAWDPVDCVPLADFGSDGPTGVHHYYNASTTSSQTSKKNPAKSVNVWGY